MEYKQIANTDAMKRVNAKKPTMMRISCDIRKFVNSESSQSALSIIVAPQSTIIT